MHIYILHTYTYIFFFEGWWVRQSKDKQWGTETIPQFDIGFGKSTTTTYSSKEVLASHDRDASNSRIKQIQCKSSKRTQLVQQNWLGKPHQN